MKRTLLLMRHAKSSWNDTSVNDSKRPLNKRGAHDAPMMGKRLKGLNYHCDRLIVSTATRAYETAKAVANAMGYKGSIVKDERLYMADIDNYLEVIAEVDEAVKHLMIVSHNPGTEAFFTYLTGERVEKFPTAAYALIEIDSSWADMKEGKLLRFDTPKSDQER
jgi:phosphohistidine phosphatase